MFYAIIAYLKHEKMNVNVADVLAAKTVIVMVFFLKSVRAMICNGVPEEVPISVLKMLKTLPDFHFTLVSKFFTREFSVNVKRLLHI